MATPNKVTPEALAEMLRRWNAGETCTAIASALGLHPTTIGPRLRRILGVATPDWKGAGRVALRHAAYVKPLAPAVIYADNPPRLARPFEMQYGEAGRFWTKVAAPNERGCRLWLVSKIGAYGQFGTRTSPATLAHRVAWRLTYGLIPDGKQINHRCDVPACCEPTHLWCGTQVENMQDMAAKGRRRGIPGAKGEANVTAKLTWEKVREMRRLREERGLTLDQLVERFEISKSQASNIVGYRQWVE